MPVLTEPKVENERVENERGIKQSVIDIIATYSYEEAFEKSLKYFNGNDLAAKVFLDKYALRDNNDELLEATPDQMHRRLAREFARIEKDKFKKPLSEDEIFAYLDEFKRIIPQGSILYGLGNKFQTISLSNCFVLDSPLDSYGGIHRTDEQLSQISKRRGGTGLDVSHLRPQGSSTKNAARTSTGIIPFMERFSNSIREVGQCLHEDTLVLCLNGLKKIKSVEAGEQVWTENAWVPVWNVVKSKKSCIQINMKSGRKIVCSSDHKIHTPEGEKKSGSLKQGDTITQIVGHGWEGKPVPLIHKEYERSEYNGSNRLNANITLPEGELSQDLAYLLGYSYGDGYVASKTGCQHYALELATSHDWPGIESKLCTIIEDCFNKKCSIRIHQWKNNTLRLNSTRVVRFLKHNGLLKQKAEFIEFPKQIMSAGLAVAWSFIAGYFDADGCAQESKKVYKFASISKSFLSTIQHVLSACGIVSKIHHQGRARQGWKDLYTLSINGGRSQELFREFFSNKSIKIAGTDHWDKKRDFSRTNYKITDFGSNSGRHSAIVTNDSWLTYSTDTSVVEELDVDRDVLLLHEEVDSVENYEDGKIIDTYDLQLEDTHFFWANGVYVSNSGRRGALMQTCSIHHPEILEFAKVKRDLTKVTGANISVRLTDEFLDAVQKDKEYEQRWPVDSENPKISKMVNAREVWMHLVENAHAMAEPGLIFWDNIIRESPADCYASEGFRTTATNPCSELPLSPLDSCRLLLLNLFAYVEHPFKKTARFNFDAFAEDVGIAQRLMDDVIDLEIEKIDQIIKKVMSDPEPVDIKKIELNLWKGVKSACERGRRTGTGITALGDTLAALGVEYGSDKGLKLVEKIYRTLKLSAYRGSVDMAKELGHFAVWNHEQEKECPFLLRIKEQDENLWNDMRKHGRRNISLLTTAPAGTVSILAKTINRFGTSSGIEPQFTVNPYTRRKKINPSDKNAKTDFVDQSGDHWQEFEVYPSAVLDWIDESGEKDLKKSPWNNSCAEELDWKQRVKLQAAAQKHIDHSISSTLNLPEDVSVEQVAEIYETAWKAGVKGITVYRKNCRTGVLIEKNSERNGSIVKTTAPKRPKSIDSEIYFTTVKGEHYFVIVGALENGTEPYEIFVGNNGFVSKRGPLKGATIRESRGRYNGIFDGDIELKNISSFCSDEEESLTRMVSTALRHGADASFVVHQLEKAKGDLQSPSKAIARVLKKWIKDGTKITGESCETCGGDLKRESGCAICISCGASKCM